MALRIATAGLLTVLTVTLAASAAGFVVDHRHIAKATWVLMARIAGWQPPTVPGDADADGDVDMADLNAFIASAAGPAIPLADPCTPFDLDHDIDADQTDFAPLRRCISGPGMPANAECAE